jgi:hypothetical protein
MFRNTVMPSVDTTRRDKSKFFLALLNTRLHVLRQIRKIPSNLFSKKSYLSIDVVILHQPYAVAILSKRPLKRTCFLTSPMPGVDRKARNITGH